MIAFDTDIASELLGGRPATLAKAAGIPRAEQSIAVTVAEEILSGRLLAIRKAAARPGRLPAAYDRLMDVLRDLPVLRILPFTDAAERQFANRRLQGIRMGTRDLRVAATAAAHGAVLVTRNRRDC